MVTVEQRGSTPVSRQLANAKLLQHACQSWESTSKAVASSKRMLARDATCLDARLVVAAALLNESRSPECLQLLLDGDSGSEHSVLWNQLAASAAHDMGNIQAAMRYYATALRLEPHYGDGWLALGELYEQTGQHRRAIAYYRRGVIFEDAGHACSLRLAQLLIKRRNTTGAIQALHSSLLRDRRSAVLNQTLAKILEHQANRLRRRRPTQTVNEVLVGAAECYRIAAAAQTLPGPYLSLGAIEQRLGRFDDAIASFRRVLELDPTNAHALLQIANHDMEHGDFDQAVQGYEKVLAIDPSRAEAHFRYSRSQKFKAGETTQAYTKRLVELLEKSPRRFDRMHLHFALAKVLDDTGEYDAAWKHYDLANRHKPSHSRTLFERKTKRRRPRQKLDINDFIQFFTPEYFSQPTFGSASKLPIFIVGMPRSGTTLCEQILSSHAEIAGAGELKDIESLRRKMLKGTNANGRTIRLAYPDLLRDLSNEALGEIAKPYLNELAKHQQQAIRVTDKMPTNFMHLGLIAKLFPNATIIHCRRNPMDIFVSSYCQNLNSPFCDLELLVEYYNDYKRLMRHWNSVLPIPIHTVDYETLVADPETETRKLIAATGLAWDDQCLNFNQNERAVRTPSKWQVRQPMYSSSVEKWRRFESHLQDIMSRIAPDE